MNAAEKAAFKEFLASRRHLLDELLDALRKNDDDRIRQALSEIKKALADSA